MTPSHFLIEKPAIMPHELDVSALPIYHLRCFEPIKSQLKHFWKHWTQKYLTQLQKKGKWITIDWQVKIGDLAILKADNMAVMKWSLIRVVNVDPGNHGVVRLVSVQTIWICIPKYKIQTYIYPPTNRYYRFLHFLLFLVTCK